MTIAEPLVVLPTAQIAQTSLAKFSSACGARLAAGERLITIFGRPDGDDHVVVTAVTEGLKGHLGVLRGRGKRGESYPSITVDHSPAHLFERELWEQTGLVPDAHPWLKPVRFEGERQTHMTDYPFYSLRGKEVHEVGVGPIHAGVIEPGHFRFMCHGEDVHHLEIQLGYQHRGVEKLLLQRPPLGVTSMIESIAGDSSIAYAWTYCAAMEALAEVPVGSDVELVRGVALEPERIGIHLVGLAGLAIDVAFLQGGATYGRLRTAIINASMRACGSRFGRGWLRPGGVRAGITDELRADLKKTLAAFTNDFLEVNDLMVSSISVRDRFQGVGTVTTKAAKDVGLVGHAARASGVSIDTRVSIPGHFYGAHPISVLTEQSGDCWGRLRQRQREIEESLRWIAAVLDNSSLQMTPAKPLPIAKLRPDTLCVSVREATRGEVVHAVETGSDGSFRHYKVQDPSFQNWFGLALSLRNNVISDFPLCNKSFDLSYCGNDL